MDKTIINFAAPKDQALKRLGPLRSFAVGTIDYIEAHIELSDGWSGYNERYAVWYTDKVIKGSLIDTEGKTVIPNEVLRRPGIVTMNLCFNYVVDGQLEMRITSFPVEALKLI